MKKQKRLINECLESFEGDKYLEKVFLYRIRKGDSIAEARSIALKTSLIGDSYVNTAVCGFDENLFKSSLNQLKCTLEAL